MRGAHQTVVIRPQRVAAMLLGAGEVEGVRRAQPEAPAQLGSLQENRLRHGERHKPVEQLTVVTVEAREWSDTSLGCAAPEQAYLEIIVSGYLVVVASANGEELQIHTDQGQNAVSC